MSPHSKVQPCKRASVIVTKYNLDSYFYILQDLDLIVPMDDKVDGKNKKTVKKSSTGSRSKPKTRDKGKADDPPEDSVSQDDSFSGDNENNNYDNYHPPSSKRKRSKASPSVSLDLFHDFLGKLDERFSGLESAIHQVPSRGKECEWAHQDNGSGETVSVIVQSESNGMPLDEESSHHPVKIRRYDNCINTNSSFTLPTREDQAGFTGLYKTDPEAEERTLFVSRSNYSDVSSDDFSVTYGNNSPCTDQGRAKSFVDSSKNPVSTGAQSPSVLTSGRLRPRAIFPSSSTVQPELPYDLAQANVIEDPLSPMQDSDIYFQGRIQPKI